MPIYEYYCERCDSRFEKLRPISTAGQPQPCPSCDNLAAAAISRTARITGLGESEGGAESGVESAFAGADDHGHGGHGHSHGPMGHTH